MGNYVSELNKIKKNINENRQKLSCSLHVKEAVQFLNALKKEYWNEDTKLSDKKFEFSFTFDDGVEPTSQIDIDFFNALAVFKLWRKQSDIINFCIETQYYFKFVNYLNRFIYFIYDPKETGGFFVNGKKINFQAFGNFGKTGLPIIPINENIYELLKKNIFEFLAEKEVKFNFQMKNFKESFNAKIENITKDIKMIDCNLKTSIQNKEKFNNLTAVQKLRIVYWNKLKIQNNNYNPLYIFCALGMDDMFNRIKSEEIFEFFKHMNVLTFLIFNTAINIIHNKENASATLKQRASVFEFENFFDFFKICNQYSMGILQLLENIIVHTDGGFFSFRSISTKSKEDYDKWKGKFYKKNEWSFIQVYLSDLAKKDDKNNCGNLINVFENKLLRRNIVINRKLNLQDLFVENQELEREEPEINENGVTYYKNLKSYLEDNNTIAHHYGLQVFVSSIVSQMGHFSVISGDNYQCEYFDSIIMPFYDSEKRIDAKDYYIEIEEKNEDKKYYCGTYYKIQLPVEKLLKKADEKETKKADEICRYYVPNDLTFDAETENMILTADYRVPRSFNLQEKENIIKQKVDEIKQIFENELNESKIEKLCIDEKSVAVINLLNNKIDNKIENDYTQMELLTKTIFLLVSGGNTKNSQLRNIVIKGFSNLPMVLTFINLYSQFYNRFGENPSISPSPQIMLIYKHNNVENYLTLSGKYLGRPLYDYRNFSGGEYNDNKYLNKIIGNAFYHPTKNSKSNDRKTFNNPHYFDNILLCDERGNIKKWHKDLNAVLETRLSDKEKYGVLIDSDETHMHISGVHLNKFYKVESLFTNAYWSKKFSQSIIEIIKKQLDEYKDISKLVLYGYERLTEPMFLNVKKDLNLHNISVDYIIYDAGYHYTAEKTAEPQISGVNKIKDNFDEKCLVLYVMSISTTCHTFFKMKKLMTEKVGKYSAKDCYYAIIQLYDESEYNIHKKYGLTFQHDLVKRVDGSLNKTFNNNIINVGYLIAAPAKWSVPENCKLCYPDKNSREMALYCTDDTSLVPHFMIVDKEKIYHKENPNSQTKAYQFDFFEKDGKEFKFQNALIYGHIVRGVSHYRSYIDTEKLIEIIKQDEKLLDEKISAINLLCEDSNESKCVLEDFINIIVAPYHTTNQTFPSLINEKLFNGKAHIISFNATKMFRSNFVAEFDGFADLINKIKMRDLDYLSHIKFYYVDDQINTGSTFNRTKMLISNLLGYNKEHLFSAIILLIDRHSNATKKSYIDKIENYYSFFSFLSSNLRNMGDMCPLCKQVAQDKYYLKESGLSSIAEFCYERMFSHKVCEISKIKEDFLNNLELRKRGMRRFYVEEQIYQGIEVNTKDDSCRKVEELYKKLIEILRKLIEKNNDDIDLEQLEIVISFVKNLSRPFLSYRPALATASLAIIKDIIKSICYDKNEIADKKLVLHFDYNEKIEIKISENVLYFDKLISLLLVCVSGLSNLNSTYLLSNLDHIAKIIKKFDSIKDNLSNEKFSDINKTIFNYYPDATIKKGRYAEVSEIGLRKKSFADYLRFSIFRLLRNKPYGKDRRKKFDEHLSNALSSKSLNYDLKYLYILLYLENGKKDYENTTSFENTGIEILKTRMEEQLSLTIAKADYNKRNGKELNALSKIICGCEPYIIDGDWLIPLTPDGEDDAFLVGYDIFMNKDNKAPIETAYDDVLKQLCGKLKLNKSSMDALKTTGISLTCNIKTEDKYVFVLLKNFDIENIEDIEGASIVLRFKVEELKGLSVEENDYMKFISGLRNIILLRKYFMNKLKYLLNSGTLGKLREQNEKNTALSISKAGKHGNAKLECIMASNKYENKEPFNKIHKLIANRVISAIYRIEAIAYKENKNVGKPYSDTVLSIFFQDDLKGLDEEEEVNNISAMDEIIRDIIKGGLEINGVYGEDKEENAGDNAKAKLTIKADIHKVPCKLYGINYNDIDLHNVNVFVYSILLFAYNAIRHSRFYLDEKNERDLKLSIETEEDKIYFVCTSKMTEEEYNNEEIERAKKSIAIPPWIRDGDSDERGITLWTLGRYFKRCWLLKDVENKKAVDVFDVFDVDSLKENNGEYHFKIKIRIN